MKRPHAFVVLALLGLVWPAQRPGAVPLLDVLFLSDGTSVAGVIMEEQPGKSLVLETESGELLEYRLKDIDRIEKQLLEEEPLIQNRDVVYLKDGVVFRGMIVGRVPGKEITLELENGQLLGFPTSEIAKIGKEQVATGVVKKGALKPKSAEKERVEVQMQIALGQLQAKRDQKKAAGGGEGDTLQEEIDRLEEEMQELQEQQQEAEAAAAEEAEGFAAVESEFGALRSQVLGAAEELQGRIAACGSATAKRQLEAAYADLQRSIDEVMQRAQVIALVEQPDPRIVQIELEQKTTSGTAIAQSRLWKDPRYAEQWQALVAELPHEQRREIFREAKSTGAVGRALVNAIPFGGFLGSWRKRDPAAAVTAGLIVGGLGVWIYEGSTPANDEGLLAVGGTMVLASWGFGIVEPFFHVLGQNMKLRDALELDRRGARTASGEGAAPLRSYEFLAPPPESRIRLHLVRYEY